MLVYDGLILLYNRQGWYNQIAKHEFLVAKNGIKMRCRNFYIYLRSLVRNWGKYSTAN